MSSFNKTILSILLFSGPITLSAQTQPQISSILNNPYSPTNLSGELTPLDVIWPGKNTDENNQVLTINDRLNVTENMHPPFPLNSWLGNVVSNRNARTQTNGTLPYQQKIYSFGPFVKAYYPWDKDHTHPFMTRLSTLWDAFGTFYPYPLAVSLNFAQAAVANDNNSAPEIPPQVRGIEIATPMLSALDDSFDPTYHTYRIAADTSQVDFVISVAANPDLKTNNNQPIMINTEELPTNMAIDQATAWSANFTMNYSQSTNKKISMNGAHGSPFLFFTAENGANPAFLPLGQGANAAVYYPCHQNNGELTCSENNNMPEGQFTSIDGQPYGFTILKVVKQQDNVPNHFAYYAIFAPTGSQWFISQIKGTMPTPNMSAIKLTYVNGNTSYFSILSLPPAENDRNINEIAQDVEKNYLPFAFHYITATHVNYNIQHQNNQTLVQTQYKADVIDVFHPNNNDVKTVLGVLPLQTDAIIDAPQWYQDQFKTVRGTLHLFSANQFTTQMTYPGILPELPSLPSNDNQGLSIQKNAANAFADDEDLGPNNDGIQSGADTYATGRRLNRLAQAMEIEYQVGNTQRADQMRNLIEQLIGRYFVDPKQQSGTPTYFYKNEILGSIIGYPGSYGTDYMLHDHVFHYGYFIEAAAHAALHDPAWGQQYKNVINQLILDTAYVQGLSVTTHGSYPYASWDPYMGHPYVSGLDVSNIGPNIESSSEGVNEYAGMILWGEATQQPQITQAGIALYTTDVYSIWHNEFDHENFKADDKGHFTGQSYFLDKYKQSISEIPADFSQYSEYSDLNPEQQNAFGLASIIHSGEYKGATFWTTSPIDSRMINALPFTGASLYLAMDPTYVDANYNAGRYQYDQRWSKTTNTDILNGYPKYQWQDLMDQYHILGNTIKSQNALNEWQTHVPDPSVLHPQDDQYLGFVGESPLHTYTWLRTFSDYGIPNFAITTGDTPFYAVLEKNGVKTYAAYNAADQTKNVVFSDGTTLTVAPKQMAVKSDGQPIPPQQLLLSLNKPIIDEKAKTATIQATVIVPAQWSNDVLVWEANSTGLTVENIQYNAEKHVVTILLKGLEEGQQYSAIIKVTDQKQNIMTSISSESFGLKANNEGQKFTLTYYFPPDDLPKSMMVTWNDKNGDHKQNVEIGDQPFPVDLYVNTSTLTITSAHKDISCNFKFAANAELVYQPSDHSDPVICKQFHTSGMDLAQHSGNINQPGGF